MDEDGAARDLFAAIIRQALQDAQAGRPCAGRCTPRAHVCRRDAVRFLRSRWCACILAWLDLPPEVQADLVARARQRSVNEKKRRTLQTE